MNLTLAIVATMLALALLYDVLVAKPRHRRMMELSEVAMRRLAIAKQLRADVRWMVSMMAAGASVREVNDALDAFGRRVDAQAVMRRFQDDEKEGDE